MSLLFSGFNNYGFGRQVGSISGKMPGALYGAGAWRFKSSAIAGQATEGVPRTGQTSGWSMPVKSRGGPYDIALSLWLKPDAKLPSLATNTNVQSTGSYFGDSGHARKRMTASADLRRGDPRNGRYPWDFSFGGYLVGLDAKTAWSGLFSATAGSITVLAKPFRAVSANANAYADAAIVTSSAFGSAGISFSSSGVRAYGYDTATAAYVVTGFVACNAGTWHQIDMRWSATTLSIRVDGGTWVNATIPSGVGLGSLNDPFKVGSNYVGSSFVGEIMEVITAAATRTDAALNSITTYFNSEYELTLGTTEYAYDLWMRGAYPGVVSGQTANFWKSTTTNAGDREPVFDVLSGAVAPPQGTPRNGYYPASFQAGSSHALTTESGLHALTPTEHRKYGYDFGDFVTDQRGMVAVLFKPSGASAPAAHCYDDPGLLVMGGGGSCFGIHYTTSGVHVSWYDGLGPDGGWWKLQHSSPCAQGAYHTVYVRWDTTGGSTGSVKIYIDGGSAQAFTVGATGALAGASYSPAPIYVGVNYSFLAFFEGEVMEVALGRSVYPLLSQINKFRLDANTRYGLSVGLLVGSAPIAFAQAGAATGAATIAGSSPLAFAQVGLAKGAGRLIGTSPLTFGQTGLAVNAVTLSGAATLAFDQDGVLTGEGAVAGTAAASFAQTGALTAKGAVAGTAPVTFGQTGLAKGAGSITGASPIALGQLAAVTAAGALVGSAALVLSSNAALTAKGAVAGSSSATLAATATLAASGALVGATLLAFGSTALDTATGALAGNAAVVLAATATASGAGSLAGSVGLIGAGQATLTIVGTASFAFGQSGALLGKGAAVATQGFALGASALPRATAVLAGTAGLTFNQSATFGAFAFAGGQTSFALAAAAALSGAGALVGAASLALASTAAAQGRADLAATAAATLTATGAVFAVGTLAGTTTASLSSSATGVGAGAGVLAGSTSVALATAATLSLVATASVTILAPIAELTARGALLGAGALAVTGAATGVGVASLSGSAFLALTGSASLTGAGALLGAAPADLASTAALTATAQLVGAAPFTMATSGAPTGVGAIAGEAAAAFDLTASGTLRGDGSAAGGVVVQLNPGPASLLGRAAVTAAATLSVAAAAVMIATAALRGDTTISSFDVGGVTGLASAAGHASLGLTTVGAVTPVARRAVTFRLRVAERTRVAIRNRERVATLTKSLAMTAIHFPPHGVIVINIGDIAQLDADFYVNNVLTNPSTVSLIVKPPGAGASVTYVFGTDLQITQLAAGKFRGAIDCTTPGVWRGRWVSTGIAQGAEEFAFTVAANSF